MSLDAADATNINRFFTAIRSLNELDQSEIRNVVGGLLRPNLLERYLTLNYQRAVINIELLLTLTDTKQFQAITGLTRSIFETIVELKLLATIPNAAEKATLFTNLEKLKAAKRIVRFTNSHPDARVDTTTHQEFIAVNEAMLVQQKQQTWPSIQKLTHWSWMNMEERTRHLKGEFEKIYNLYYPLLSWYIHSGVTGLSTLTAEAFAHLCGVAYTVVIDCYALMLEIMALHENLTKGAF